MFIYGPKKALAPKDTVYYSLPAFSFIDLQKNTLPDSSVITGPSVIVLPASQKKDSASSVTGLLNYMRFRSNDLLNTNFVFMLVTDSATPISSYTGAVGLNKQNFHDAFLPANECIKLKEALLLEENAVPAAFKTGKSNMVLLDGQRRIRGYYDAKYDVEVKRMLEDHKFLQFYDAAKEVVNTNKVEQHRK